MEIEANTDLAQDDTGEVKPFVVVSSPEMHGVARRVVETIARVYGIGLPHYEVSFERFKNGELLPRLEKTVRRQHVFFFHAMQVPTPNDGVMGALLMNDALRRASAAGITLVAPYLPYLRQDRKDKPRAPISAKMLADVLGSNPSLERVITADMHTDQAQGFFNIPVDNISCMKLFALYAKQHIDNVAECVMGAPDVGGVVRAERFGLTAGSPYIAFCQKKRPAANKSVTGATAGDPVKGRRVIMVDDMIDTGGSTIGAAKKFMADGATGVSVFATHAIFSDHAEERLAASGLRIFTTNSIPRPDAYAERHKEWLTVIPVEELLAAAVYQASLVGGSLSKLSV
jgi:ribose-phosphate pyrophosphokinase